MGFWSLAFGLCKDPRPKTQDQRPKTQDQRRLFEFAILVFEGKVMKPSNQPVTSREYKVMLNTNRFKDRSLGGEEFLGLIAFLIEKEGGTVVERQNKEERRQTSYLDTPQFALRQNGYSLRLREEADSFQLNLKYRDADRYVSAGKDLSASADGKLKFEEDILPPFTSKFSHSNSIESAEMPQLEVISKVTSLFPGLKELELDETTPVITANNFKALEVTRKLCKFQFGQSETLKASLSFWYLQQDTHWPLVAEFSFDYDAKKGQSELESYSPQVVTGASSFFRSVQNQAGWLDLTTTTKTAFALEVL